MGGLWGRVKNTPGLLDGDSVVRLARHATLRLPGFRPMHQQQVQVLTPQILYAPLTGRPASHNPQDFTTQGLSETVCRVSTQDIESTALSHLTLLHMVLQHCLRVSMGAISRGPGSCGTTAHVSSQCSSIEKDIRVRMSVL